MKKIILSLSLVALCFIFINAKKETSDVSLADKHVIKKKVDESITTLSVSYVRTGGEIEITHQNITRIEAYDESARTALPVFAYLDWSIDHGWGFYGECLVYGTFYTGNNGVTLFVPCGLGCVGFNPICPDEGNGLCRLSFKK